MFGLSPFELVVIGVIAVILFGGNLPDVARKLGGSYREFRRGLNEVQQQFRMAEYEARNSDLLVGGSEAEKIGGGRRRDARPFGSQVHATQIATSGAGQVNSRDGPAPTRERSVLRESLSLKKSVVSLRRQESAASSAG